MELSTYYVGTGTWGEEVPGESDDAFMTLPEAIAFVRDRGIEKGRFLVYAKGEDDSCHPLYELIEGRLKDLTNSGETQ